MRLLALVLMSGFLQGCFTPEKISESAQQAREEGAEALFSRGLKLMEAQKNEEAIETFNSVLTKFPGSSYSLVSIYNRGSCYMNMGQCDKAVDEFRRVTMGSPSEAYRLKAQGLLELSYAYECLGESHKVITTLLDARRRRDQLPEDIAKTEVPGRLASAYARLGNVKEAEKYFKEAQQGLIELQARNKDSKSVRDLMARTLYLMGRPHEKEISIAKAGHFLQSFGYLQKYLLKAAETDAKQWSTQAIDNLLEGYDRILTLIKEWPSPAESDEEISQRNRQSQQRVLAEKTLANMIDLKRMRLPGMEEPQGVQRLFAEMDERERGLRGLMAELAETNPLTEAAQKRQGLRREGRVAQPNPALEVEARKRSQLPPKQKSSN